MKNIVLIWAVFFAACAVSHGAMADRLAPVPLAYGVNKIDLGPGTSAGMAVLAHRDNFNAHGFDVLTIYVKPEPVDSRLRDWQIVTAFEHDKESLSLEAGGGADCMLHDFRLSRDRGHSQPTLIVADRDMGKTYVDSMPVHFKFYELRKNTDGETGRPLYYFELTRTQTSRKPYCDVEQAFIEELGITDYHEHRKGFEPTTAPRDSR